MGWRFRKSIKLGKGVRLNLSKSGPGISVGGKGFRIGVGPKGPYSSASIPGTGLYSINYLKKGKSKRSSQNASQTTAAATAENELKPEYAYPPELKNKTRTSALIGFIISLIFLAACWPVGVIGICGIIYWQIKVAKSPDGQARKYYTDGQTAIKNGDNQQAIEAFFKVLEINPDVPVLYHILANLYEAEENYEEALKFLKKYMELDPENYSLKFQQISLLLKMEQFETALPLLQSLPPEIKQELPVLCTIAGCFLELDQPEFALEVLKQGPMRKQKMNEELMLFRYLLGITYKELGETKKAIKQLNKVYAEDIEYGDVKELLEELNS